MTLPHLRHFQCDFPGAPFLLFPWIKEQLPSVKVLWLQNGNIVSHSIPISNTTIIQNRLRSIVLPTIDENQLEILLFEVLPHFPAVSILHVDSKILSFRSIYQRLQQNDAKHTAYRSALKAVFFAGNNPVIENDPLENEARAGFLLDFSRIISFVFREKPKNPKVHHELVLNLAGRRLIEGGDEGGELPLSVWPIVFERLAVRFCPQIDSPSEEDVAAGLYNLLHNGPVLFDRRTKNGPGTECAGHPRKRKGKECR